MSSAKMILKQVRAKTYFNSDDIKFEMGYSSISDDSFEEVETKKTVEKKKQEKQEKHKEKEKMIVFNENVILFLSPRDEKI